MIPLHVQAHLAALGVGDAGIDLLERETQKALLMSSDELKQAIERKNEAITYLRVQQAIYLALLEDMKC